MVNKSMSYAPKGWNSWDCYGASVREDEVLANAEIIRDELLVHGWDTVVVDIQWYEPNANSSAYNKFTELFMDDYSRLIPAINRFPSAKQGNGFKELSNKIHAMGLKFGIHIMRGIPRQAVHNNTKLLSSKYTARDIAHPNSLCPWNTDMYGLDTQHPGSQEYYDSLFKLYADWGVDYIKVDDIADSRLYGAHLDEINMIHSAIEKSGREMVLSLSPGPTDIHDADLMTKYATMWRIADDFWDQWALLLNMFDRCKLWAPYVKAGSYPDCDMLPMGRIGIRSVDGGATDRYTRFTKEEQRTMLTLWSLFGSPLMFGGDLRYNDEFTWGLLKDATLELMHREIHMRHEVFRNEEIIVWYGKSALDDYFAVFNISENDDDFDLSRLNLTENATIKKHDVIVFKNNKQVALYGQ